MIDKDKHMADEVLKTMAREWPNATPEARRKNKISFIMGTCGFDATEEQVERMLDRQAREDGYTKG